MVRFLKLFLFVGLYLCVAVVSVQAASITGTIVYEGEAPQMKPVKMDADPACAAKHTEPVLAEILVLGEGQTMANVLVYVKSGLPGKTHPVPQEPVVMDQAGCRYDPHVVGVRAGQPVQFLNPDGTLHNVHALPKENDEFNMAMPKFKTQAIKTFDKVEGPFPLKCDVHPWMTAWIATFDHPYFDVTDKSGTFSLDDLDKGTYDVEVWHEKLGTQSASVTVGADGAVADFTFSRP